MGEQKQDQGRPQQQQQQVPSPFNGVRVVKPQQFDPNTAQTPGMRRLAAVSRELAGARGLWAGLTLVAPHVASGKHHHGELETVIYVVSGRARIRWGERLEYEQDVEPGDFIYVPPFVPHQEINPSDEESCWVIVRNAQEPVVVNLDAPGDQEQAPR
ncbi:cupin domain-containing protein [Thermogemmatispora onikobensis]|uniref:cupin domain-containing protein n=1 Tax=Thermogemmatispora onikobensis TaxID=732234 RepID=UPI000A06E43A|nr:cupin domain-containing protein [Thermogemmatispora onikobensis]